MIKLNLDVTKISKDRLFKGAKGTYLNAVLVETPNSTHSDYMIVEDVTKEERESGKKGVILGNGKILGKGQGKPRSDDPAPKANTPTPAEQDGFEVPF